MYGFKTSNTYGYDSVVFVSRASVRIMPIQFSSKLDFYYVLKVIKT